MEELLATYEQPAKHWKRIRATSAIERLLVEARRRIPALGAFPTRDSCGRIIFSIFQRVNQY